MFLLSFLHVIVNINFSKFYKNVSYYEWNVQSQNILLFIFMLDFEKYFIIIYFIIVFILYLKI